MSIDGRIRWLLGGLGILSDAVALVLAFGKADSATTIAFLAAGVLLVLVAVLPRVPSEISFGAGSIKYPAEQLATQEYAAYLEQGLGEVRVSEFRAGLTGDEEPVGSAGYPGLEEIRQMASAAATPAELDSALELARTSARGQVQQVRELLDRAKSKQ